MRRPEFLMMRRPCAALRRPAKGGRTASILLLVESQRFSQYSCLKCSYISKDKTTQSRCFLALYIEIEYTVKIISVLN